MRWLLILAVGLSGCASAPVAKFGGALSVKVSELDALRKENADLKMRQAELNGRCQAVLGIYEDMLDRMSKEHTSVPLKKDPASKEKRK